MNQHNLFKDLFRVKLLHWKMLFDNDYLLPQLAKS